MCWRSNSWPHKRAINQSDHRISHTNVLPILICLILNPTFHFDLVDSKTRELAACPEFLQTAEFLQIRKAFSGVSSGGWNIIWVLRCIWFRSWQKNFRGSCLAEPCQTKKQDENNCLCGTIFSSAVSSNHLRTYDADCRQSFGTKWVKIIQLFSLRRKYAQEELCANDCWDSQQQRQTNGCIRKLLKLLFHANDWFLAVLVWKN